jgi:hypothetical protein
MAVKEFVISPGNYFEEEFFDGDYTERQNQSFGTLTCNAKRLAGIQLDSGVYFAEGYFDGVYAASNQIRTELTCTADRTATFQFLAGFYFEEGFIEEGAFGVNSIIATLEVEAMVVQEATVGLTSYYQEGYYASGYFEQRGSQFTLTADLTRTGQLQEASADLVSEFLQAAQVERTLSTAGAGLSAEFLQAATAATVIDATVPMSAEFTLDAGVDKFVGLSIVLSAEISQVTQAAKIVDTVSEMSAEFTQTATISHIEGADLFAFAEAQLAVEVQRIRDNNIAATAVFDIAVDYIRTKSASSEQFAASLFSVDNLRVRYEEAALDAAFSISVDSTVIRSATSAVTVNSQLSAQGVEIQRASATLTSNFTLTASGLDLDLASANLSATTALAVSAIKTARISSTLSSNFVSTAVSRIYPVGNAWGPTRFVLGFDNNLVDRVSGITAASQNQGYTNIGRINDSYGSHLVGYEGTSIGGQNIGIARTSGTYPTIKGSENFSYDLKLKPRISVSGTPNLPNNPHGIFLRFSNSAGNVYRLYYTAGTSSITFRVNKDSTILLTHNYTDTTQSPDINYFSWKSVQLTRHNGTAYFYIDGALIGTFSMPELFGSATTFAEVQQPSGNYFAGKIDEARHIIGDISPSYNVSSIPYTPNYEYGIVYLESRSSLTTDFLKVKFGQAALSSQSQSSVSARRLRSTPIATTSTANLTAATNSISSARAQLVSTSTIQVNANRLRSTPVAVTTTASLTANNLRARNFDSAVNSTADLTADSGRIRFDLIELETETALSANVTVIRSAVIATESIASTLSAVVKIGDFLVGLDVIVTVTVDGIIEVNPIIDLASEFLQTANATKLVVAESSQSVETELFAESLRVRPGEITANSTSELSVEAIKLVEAKATLTTTTAMTANVDRARDIIISLTATAAVTAQGSRTREVASDMFSEFYDFTCSPQFLFNAEANLIALAFNLTAGRVIHLDELLTYRIPAETRYFKINDETRVYTIEEETRIIKIKGYPL